MRSKGMVEPLIPLLGGVLAALLGVSLIRGIIEALEELVTGLLKIAKWGIVATIVYLVIKTMVL